MISDPKNQQKRLQNLHQFVNTSHLITAYIASFSQYQKSAQDYPEIDSDAWKRKILAELTRTDSLLNHKEPDHEILTESSLKPGGTVEELLAKRKKEISENDIVNHRNPNRITHLTELKNLTELLELLFDAAKEQRKVAEKLMSQP